MEKFVDVYGYKGIYKIGDRGNIWLERRNRFGDYKRHKDKSTVIVLSRYGKRERVHLHMLVARHFVPNPGSRGVARVINGDFRDMRPENLEWVSNEISVEESGRFMGRPEPEFLRQGRLTHSDVRHIRKMYGQEGLTQQQIAKMYRVTPASIWNIVNRHTWKNVK